ncbi:MAG: HPr family phosphocarrier protein [SAR324 cluster bacterium]|nr:HPr family phosphocarrier protein [SAR324 cluster bacterium]
MKTAKVTIINKLGMHARAAAKLVQLSHQFDSKIILNKGGELADAKSITDILMLAGAKYTELTLSVEVQDEDAAIEEIQRLITDKFGEEE